MNILRELAIAIIAGCHAATEAAPAPKAKVLPRTWEHSSAREGDLPVLFAICQGRHGDANGERYGKQRRNQGT
jgi:hypothetical protein